MNEFVDGAVVAFLVVVGVSLTKFWQVVKERLPFWEKMSDTGREIGGYVIILINVGLFWLLQVNAIPGLGEVAGRVFTCVAAALSPGSIYDIFLDRPAQDVTLVMPNPDPDNQNNPIPVEVVGVAVAACATEKIE